MEETGLKNLFQIIRKRWLVILSLTVFILILGIVYTFLIVKPIYQSDTSIYIGKYTESESKSIMYNDVLLNDRLVKDYREIVKSRLIADEVIKEMNLKDITYKKLASKLDVTSKEDTRLIVISATDINPEFSKNLADKVAEAFQKKATEIMKVENIQIIDKAIIPEVPIKPNKIANITISFLIGLMISLFVVNIIEYFDDTIKTPEDVIKQLDLSVIGAIPVFHE